MPRAARSSRSSRGDRLARRLRASVGVVQRRRRTGTPSRRPGCARSASSRRIALRRAHGEERPVESRRRSGADRSISRMRPRWISATRSQRDASSMYGVETTIVSPPSRSCRAGPRTRAARRRPRRSSARRATGAPAVHQRAAERELLLHPARQRAGAAVLERLELLVDRRDQRRALLHRGAEHRREERRFSSTLRSAYRENRPGM